MQLILTTAILAFSMISHAQITSEVIWATTTASCTVAGTGVINVAVDPSFFELEEMPYTVELYVSSSEGTSLLTSAEVYAFEHTFNEIYIGDHFVRWYSTNSCYYEVNTTTPSILPDLEEFKLNTSLGNADCFTDFAEVVLPAGEMEDNYYTVWWSEETGRVENFSGFEKFNASHPSWEAGRYTVVVFDRRCSLSKPIVEYVLDVPCCAMGEAPTIGRIGQPSDCSSADGSFTMFPYTYYSNIGEIDWYVTDVSGNYFEGSSSGLFENIPAGTYILQGEGQYIEFNGTQSEWCVTPSRRITLGGESGYFSIPEKILASCEGQSNGTVLLAIDGPVDAIILESPVPNYTFELIGSDGAPDYYDYQYSAEGLPAGEHCITVSNNEFGCSSVLCFTVPAYSAGQLQTPRSSITEDCGQSGRGRIELWNLPNSAAYTIIWADGAEGSVRHSLLAGEYCYELTTICGETVSECLTIGDVAQDWEYSFIRECGRYFTGSGSYDLSSHRFETIAGERPFFIGDILTGTRRYSVTAGEPNLAASFGSEDQVCTRAIENTISPSDIEVEFGQPCGDNDGYISFLLTDNSVVELEISINDDPFPYQEIASGVYQGSIGLLPPGNYRLILSLDGCEFEFRDRLIEGFGIEKTFDYYDELCYYTQSCNGIPVNETFAALPNRGGSDDINEPWLGSCSIDLYCDKVASPVETEKFHLKTVSKSVYQLLFGLAELSGSPYLVPRSAIQPKYFSQSSMCARVRYCPLTMEPVSYNPLRPGNGSNTYIDPETGCIHSSCGVFDRTICDFDEFLPPGTEVNEDDLLNLLEQQHCEYRSLTIPELISFHEDLLEVEGYEGSTLEAEAIRLIAAYQSPPPIGIYCARVSYCVNTFDHIGTDFIDPFGLCGERMGPVSEDDPPSCPSLICESCFTTTSEGCVMVHTACPIFPNPCITCLNTAYQIEFIDLCYPGDEYFLPLTSPTLPEKMRVVNKIMIPSYYSPHRSLGFIDQWDEQGNRIAPGSLLESPFTTTVDLEAYEETVSQSDYKGLKFLSDAEGEAASSIAIEQSPEAELVIRFNKEDRFNQSYTDKLISGKVEFLDAYASFARLYLLVKADGTLFLDKSSIVSNSSAESSYLLVFDRVNGNLISTQEAASGSKLKEVVGDDSLVAMISESEQGSTIQLIGNATLEFADFPFIVDALAFDNESETYFITNSINSNLVEVRYADEFQALSTTMPALIQRIDGQTDKPLVVFLTYGFGVKLIVEGASNLEVEKDISLLKPSNIYAIDIATMMAEEVATLFNSTLANVYTDVIDGYLPIQVQVKGSSDSLTTFALNNAPGLNTSSYNQIVTTAIKFNSLSPDSNVMPRSASRESNKDEKTVIFPNPSTGYLSIKGLEDAEEIKASAVNSMGKLLPLPASLNSSTSGQLDATSLVDGIYLIRASITMKNGLHKELAQRIVIAR